MKRPEQHVIDEEAQKCFTSTLPAAWVVRRQDPDYGIDYVVEIVENTQLTGVKFAVQLKGKSNIRRLGAHISYPMATKHLKYYFDKERMPVFLVVVNTKNCAGYWLFLQKYIAYELSGRNWRQQQSVTVRVPATNLLDDAIILANAARSAEEFMTGLRPGAIRSAIRAHLIRKQSLDPRFNIDLEIKGDKTHYQLKAKEPVRVDLLLKGTKDKTERIVEDLIGRGLPVTLTREEFEVKGSPLLEDLMSESGTLCCRTSTNAAIHLSEEQPDRVVKPITFQGILEGGTKEARFASRMPASPLEVQCVFRLIHVAVVSASMHWSITWQEWCGRPLRHLPFFESILRLVRAVCNRQVINMEVDVAGNAVLTCKSMTHTSGLPDGALQCLEILTKAREIADLFSLDVKLPARLGRRDFEEVQNLYEMLVGANRQPKNGKDMLLGAHLDRAGITKLLSLDSNMRENGTLSICRSSGEYPFLGITAILSRIDVRLTHAKLITPIADLRAALESPSNDSIEVRWQGTERSEITFETELRQVKEV